MKKSMKVLVISLMVMLATASAATKFGVYTTPLGGVTGPSQSDIGLMMCIDKTFDIQFEFINFTDDYLSAGSDAGSAIALTGTWYTAKLGGLDFGPALSYSSVSAGETYSDLYLGASLKTMMNKWLGVKADGYLYHSKSGKLTAAVDYKGSSLLPPATRVAFFVLF